MMNEDIQDLPHIEFDTEMKTNEINLEEDFDVFKAANGQRRRRSSIISYTGNRNNIESNKSEDVITSVPILIEEKEDIIIKDIVKTKNQIKKEKKRQSLRLAKKSASLESKSVSEIDVGTSISEKEVLNEELMTKSISSLPVNLELFKVEKAEEKVVEKLNTVKQDLIKKAETFTNIDKISVSKQVKNILNKSSGLCAPTQSTNAALRTKISSSFSTCNNSNSGNIVYKKKITVPQSPHKNHRIRVEKPIESSSDREKSEIERIKKLNETKIMKAKKSFERVKVKSSNQVTNIVRSTKQLTIPSTPVSHLLKRKGSKIKVNDEVVSNDASKSQTLILKGPSGATITVPFKFATDSRVKENKNVCNELTSAEMALKFMQNSRSYHVSTKACVNLTKAKAPVFASTKNTTKVMSKEELEELEMNKIKENPFKALPVDPRIFESMGDFGVPKVISKPVTATSEFSFHTDKRLGVKTTTIFEEDNTKSTTQWVAKKTMPVSPKLSGGRRASLAPARRQLKNHEIVEQEKLQAISAALTALKIKNSIPKTLTEPKEFHLETSERCLASKAMMEERINLERENEEKMREVKANPVPNFNKIMQIQPSTKELTNPEEFKLRSIARHNEAALQFKEELTNLQKEKIRLENFHANPLPASTYDAPVAHVKPFHEPVVPDNINLVTDIRSMKRKEFDQQQTQRIIELSQKKIEQEKENEDKENNKVKEMRRKSVQEGGMMFKANPIIKKDLYPTKSQPTKPLTEAISPQFKPLRSRNV